MNMSNEHTFELIRDLYKDVMGFRPSNDWMNKFNALSYAEKKSVWDTLCAKMDESISAEKAESDIGRAKFEADVANIMETMKCNRDRAIYILAKSFCKTDSDFTYILHDAGYLTHQYGFYNSKLEDEIVSILRIQSIEF